MNVEHTEIRVKGKSIHVPSATVYGMTVIASGKRMKIANVMDEQLVEGETVRDPTSFVLRLKETGLNADIFTFAQKLPDVAPRYQYHLEWDNAAVIPITNFSDWWEKRAEYDVRKAVKRARKLGVEVKVCEFNDAFVEGICRIYNDSPTRQGKPFWHYQKEFEEVKRENSTYLERSVFVGAYYDDDLIGFIKMVYVDSIATTLQVISQKKHSDKKPTNALIAKAVEICESNGVSHFVYGSYTYNEENSSLTEFKRRNGFEKILVPRYYVPLTLKGDVALKLNLHRPLANFVPVQMLTQIRKLRSFVNSRGLRSITEAS
jgi:hypothetical protein